VNLLDATGTAGVGRVMDAFQIAWWITLTAAAFYVFWRGQRDERLGMMILVLGSMASVFAYSPREVRWNDVELPLLAVDIVVLAAFFWLAIKSDRFWPLWVTAFQLLTVIAHLARILDTRFIAWVYAAAAADGGYLMILVMVLGTLSARKASRKRRSVI
jgi:hypothetical protein